jgi:hypothetical protein
MSPSTNTLHSKSNKKHKSFYSLNIGTLEVGFTVNEKDEMIKL